jgi:hypothetical protein
MKKNHKTEKKGGENSCLPKVFFLIFFWKKKFKNELFIDIWYYHEK